MAAIAKRVWEYRMELNKDLSARIVNDIVKALFKKGG